MQQNNQFIQFAMQLLEQHSSSSDSCIRQEQSIDLSQVVEMQAKIEVVSPPQVSIRKKPSKPKVATSIEPCHCSKSGCQKMYCECLAKGRLCSDECRCSNCHNRVTNRLVLDVMEQLDQNRVRKRFRSYRFKDGCTCQKSQCMKKYCECYQSGRSCGEGCRCVNCENIGIENSPCAIATPSRKRQKQPHNYRSSMSTQSEQFNLKRINVEESIEEFKISTVQLMVMGMR